MSDTLLGRFVDEDVCKSNKFMLPLLPLKLFFDFRNISALSAVWGTVLIVWIIIWIFVPCNPNLNCTATEPQGKDGIKALVVSFLIVFAVFTGAIVAAKIFACDTFANDQNVGGVLSNLEAVFQKKHSSNNSINEAENILKKYRYK